MSNTFKRIANTTAHYWDGTRQPSDRRGARITVPVHAEWNGGAYIDVTFGYGDPSEVINVWDYSTGQPSIGTERGAVRRVLIAWLNEHYEDERREQDDPTRNPRGEWLRAYIENARY